MIQTTRHSSLKYGVQHVDPVWSHGYDQAALELSLPMGSAVLMNLGTQLPSTTQNSTETAITKCFDFRMGDI